MSERSILTTPPALDQRWLFYRAKEHALARLWTVTGRDQLRPVPGRGRHPNLKDALGGIQSETPSLWRSRRQHVAGTRRTILSRRWKVGADRTPLTVPRRRRGSRPPSCVGFKKIKQIALR